MTQASGVRRILAVFVDAFVFFAIWGAVGLIARTGTIFYALGIFFVLDTLLTSFFGVSAGRQLAGIRVARSTGGRPGIVPALIRTALVFLTGWVGLLVISVWLAVLRMFESDRPIPSRMWWDAAAGTQMVRAH
jgi:RDD family